MNYYKRNIGDYAAATRHLSMLEHGAYTLLMDFYYTNEAPLPKEIKEICRRVGARGKEEHAAIETVLRDFFSQEVDGWTQKRCADEIAVYQSKAANNKENGKSGGRPKKKTVSGDSQNPEITQPVFDGFQEETLTINQEPLTNKQDTPQPPEGGGFRFEEFWAAWPKGERKQDKVNCAKKWKARGLDAMTDAILADIAVKRKTEKWLGGFIEAPLVYLNGRRWEDGVEPAGTGEAASAAWEGAK